MVSLFRDVEEAIRVELMSRGTIIVRTPIATRCNDWVRLFARRHLDICREVQHDNAFPHRRTASRIQELLESFH
jgi:hypothetical protein